MAHARDSAARRRARRGRGSRRGGPRTRRRGCAAQRRHPSAISRNSFSVARSSVTAWRAIAESVIRSAHNPPHHARSSGVAKHHTEAPGATSSKQVAFAFAETPISRPQRRADLRGEDQAVRSRFFAAGIAPSCAAGRAHRFDNRATPNSPSYRFGYQYLMWQFSQAVSMPPLTSSSLSLSFASIACRTGSVLSYRS